MLLATLVLSAALIPQAAPMEEETPFDAEPAPTQESVPGLDETATPPPLEDDPAPPLEATPIAEPAAAPVAPAPPSAAAQEHIEAGLAAFIRGRFSAAREEFQMAYDAAPRSAAAAFYLGYAHYKLGEPTLRMDDDKQRAKELFAKAYELDPAFQPVWGVRRRE